MKEVKIIIGRHAFVVVPLTKPAQDIMLKFNKQFQTYRKERIKKRVIVVRDKLYLVHNPIFKEYYYPITKLKDFAFELYNHDIGKDKCEIIYKDKPKRYKVDFKWKFKHPLRDYQKKYVKTITKSLIKNHTFLIDLQTGKGKGLIASKTIDKLSYRTAFLILPKYIEKWVKELKEYFKLKDSDIFVVQGSDSLTELMNMDKEHIPKFIIFSNRTMYFYIKAYEELQFKDMFQYPYLPYKLFDKLKISVLVVDETHQEFHSVYKFALVIDPTLLIGLSATLEHKDKRIMTLYELLYPKETRLSFLEYDKYIHVTAVRYLLPINKNFKYMQGGYGYNQTKFEESVLRFRNILSKFERMILHYLKIKFISRKKNKEKCLLFFGSVDMCTYMTKVISDTYPKLKVSRYVSNDSYDEMMKSDIIISTPGSSGTALDIPKLLTVLSTIATDSVQLNLQMLGRLRKQPNRDVEFVYFYCGNIDQHNKYHYNRVRLFTDKAASIKQTMYK